MAIIGQHHRRDLIRGAEVERHEYRLYFAAWRFSLLLTVLLGLGGVVIGSQLLLTPSERLAQSALGKAAVLSALKGPRHPVRLRLGPGTVIYTVPANEIPVLFETEKRNLRMKYQYTGLTSAAVAGMMLTWMLCRWHRRGRREAADIYLRGTLVAKAGIIAGALRRSGRASHVSFAGVPLEAGNETLNTIVSGATGSGKSVAITEALSAIRAANGKAIVFDGTGEFIERFYREGRDFILNPFDQRSPPWHPWMEADKPWDYANLAESFIPVTNWKEPFWEEGAQAVLEDILARLQTRGEANNRRLIDVVSLMTLEEIHDIICKLPGAVYMESEAARTALGIRMNVVRAAKALRYLTDQRANSALSIRRWVTNGTEDSWLFLSAREDMLSTMRPLLTAWIDTALRAVMSLPPDRGRLVWNVIDELASLNKIHCLRQITTRGRKYGIANILGYQNEAQLQELYGTQDAQTIISMCQNMLTLRVPDFQTAQRVARNLGAQEVIETNESTSFGADPTRDGVGLSRRRAERQLVLPSQIQGLPDMHGYLRLAGRNEVMPVQFAYRDLPVIAPALIERQVVPYALDD